ncbi:MAG: heme-copper oxidase subunit III [Deltaproteobacteria bacterium]
MEGHDATHSGAAAGHHEWEVSYWPLLLSVSVLFVLPFPFSLYFVYKNALLAVLALGIGVPLLVVSLVGWVSEALKGRTVTSAEQGLGTGALPWFIVAEAFIFVGFFAAYWATRLMAPAWPPAGTPHISMTIPIIMTIILVASSVTIHFAEEKLEHNNTSGFITWLIVTIVLGAVFFLISAYEWSHLMGEGFTFGTNIYGSSFFSITGFHASHVLVGLCAFVAVLIPALRGTVSKNFVKSASVYWHFVDIVWFFVVSQVYFW